ncbi:MAG: GumC family protein [Bacteroidota bacterium]|jgi:tyrosine-protein kinase Etk/Wzc
MSSSQEFIEQPDNDFDFRALVNKVTYHWPLFVFVGLVCLLIGNLYLRYTTPLFEANATLMIKGGKKTSYADQVIQEMEVFKSAASLENEIELLRSGPIIREVVQDLNLHHLYITEGQIRKVDVYSKIPYKLKIDDPQDALRGMEILLDRHRDGTFSVTLPDGRLRKVKAGSLNKEAWGSWMVYMVPGRYADWYYDTEVKLKIQDLDYVVSEIVARLSLSQKTQDAALIDLSIQDPVLERATDFLGRLFEVYNKASIEDKNQMAAGTIRFLDERLAIINGEIDSIEQAIQDFRIRNGLTDPQAEMELARAGVQQTMEKTSELGLKMLLIGEFRRSVEAGQLIQFMPSDFGIGDGSLSSSINQYNSLVLERYKLESLTASSSPLLKQKAEELENLKKSVLSNLSSLTGSVSKMKNQTDQTLDAYKSDLRGIPALKMELDKVLRQKEIKEELYLLLLQKREEAALSYASTTADSRIVEKPQGDSNPVSPRREQILLYALIAGFMIPLAYVFLKDAFNNKVIGLEMITKVTNTPLLGTLSEHPHKNSPIVVTDKDRSTIAEQFRTIRTNLHYIHGPGLEKGRVVMVTSSTSGEGKTFFAINLANALAISGRKVVLLELDLRKPKISKYLNQKPELGFSQYMVGETDANRIIYPTGVSDQLYFVPAGIVPPNPSELLLLERYDQLIDKLKLEFDDIIIDTPPIGLVTDAQIISRKANASVFVVRWGYTDKTWMPSLETLYRDKKLPNMGVVFNGVRLGGRYGYSYGYGYDYGYSKGYAYGYGHGKKYGYYDDEGNRKPSMWSNLVNLIKRI